MVGGAFLDQLDHGERHSLQAVMMLRRYDKGTAIFREGDLGDSLHIIEQGHVAIRASTPMGDVATLTVLRPGEAFGEQALLTTDSRRTASAVCLDRTETLRLPAPAFEALRASNPKINALLVEVLAAQVRRLSAQVLESRHLDARTRVVHRLVELVGIYGRNHNGCCEVPITQDDLASLAGVTRPTANRVLNELVDHGILHLRRGEATVVDAEQLRGLA